jgi:tetratricopeptide (TPR) repeat protein
MSTREPAESSNLAVPMTAQDMRRARIRLVLTWLAPVLIVAFAVGWYLRDRSNKQFAREIYNSAVHSAKDGEYRNAIKTLDVVIRLNPSDLRAYYLRAAAYHNLGDHYSAIQNLNELIAKNPAEAAKAYGLRGIAYRDLGDHRHAIQDLTRSLELDPNWAEGYNVRGKCFWALDDTKRAMTDFTRSIEIDPSVDAYYQRGYLRQKLGDMQGAVDDQTQAIKLDAHSPYAYRARAAARKMIGDLAGAREDRDKAEALEQ